MNQEEKLPYQETIIDDDFEESFYMADEFGMSNYLKQEKTYPVSGCLLMVASALFTFFMLIKLYNWLFL